MGREVGANVFDLCKRAIKIKSLGPFHLTSETKLTSHYIGSAWCLSQMFKKGGEGLGT